MTTSSTKTTFQTKDETQNAKAEYETASFWHQRIKEALKLYQPYFEIVKKARSFYKQGPLFGQEDTLFNPTNSGAGLFWSTIETQKPFLYFKQPQPYLERIKHLSTRAEQVATLILERALVWDLASYDFDSLMKYARDDYLIAGTGVLWQNYCPTFKTVEVEGLSLEIKSDEKVVSTYVDVMDFMIDPNHIGIFEEAKWIAKRLYMTPLEIKENFGALAYDMVASGSQDETAKTIEVFEIWDKETKKVYWLSPDFPNGFLSIQDDPLHLEGFFPIAKPLFATKTSDSLVVVPDFKIIEPLLVELSGITERMRLLMQAIKVSGAYDGAFETLGDIFDKDVQLVPLYDFERLKEAGGLTGVIEFLPINQYIVALETLAKRKEALQNEIFEITGISDIMRGNSMKTETATAVLKKTNFGTLRNQDRQNDVQRFIKDNYALTAEIICEQFSTQKLASFIAYDEGFTPLEIEAGIQILKSQKLRDMILKIETDVFFNQEDPLKKITQPVETLNALIIQGISAVSQEPLLLPLYKQMIKEIAACLPKGRIFEPVIEQAFLKIEQALETQKQKSLMSEKTSGLTGALSTISKENDLKKMELLIKFKELQLKEKELAFKSKKADLDFQGDLVKAKTEQQKVLLK